MKYEKKIFLSLFWVILGAALILCSFTGILRGDTWEGIGYGWLACGIVQIIKQLRYRKDKNYREKYDVEVNDERNKYIAMKAWAWAGYGFVLIACLASIVLLLIGQGPFAQITNGAVCLIIVLYWVSYLCLKKKY